MTAFISTAFILGAIGSTHCVAMCGPLVIGIPPVNDGVGSKFISSFLYHLGRITTYAILGLLLGLLGQSFAIAGLQNILSISLGLLILLFLFIPNLQKLAGNNPSFFNFYHSVRKKITYLFNKKSFPAIFGIGFLNGLLPCGLVYMSLASAIALSHPIKSSLFMAFFGLGTLPLLWTVTFFGHYLTWEIRKKIKFIYPVVLFTMACLLILRGFSVTIHSTSPAIFAVMPIECRP